MGGPVLPPGSAPYTTPTAQAEISDGYNSLFDRGNDDENYEGPKGHHKHGYRYGNGSRGGKKLLRDSEANAKNPW